MSPTPVPKVAGFPALPLRRNNPGSLANETCRRGGLVGLRPRAALLVAGFCTLLVPAHAQPAPASLPLGQVVGTVDLPRATPYVGEMLVVTMRSAIRANIALHDIRQPDFRNFDWQQFGIDKAITVEMNGFFVPGIERKVAIFPQRAGHFTIAAFVRHVTLVTDRNEREEADYVSNSLDLDVAAHDGIGPAGAWWLPARSVKITDSWDPQPDHIGLSETAQRKLVLEVTGMTADRLPPPPSLRAPGIIVFTGPVERETLITENAPVARVTWRYNIRPANDQPSKLPAIHIPWFDVEARVMRDAAVAEQRVAFVNPLGEERERAAAQAPAILSWQALLAGAGGFGWMLAMGLLLPGASQWPQRWWRAIAPLPPAFRDLQLAEKAGNAAAFRTALAQLERADPARWRAALARPEIVRGLHELDAAIFCLSLPMLPDLARLARSLALAWRQHGFH